MVTLSTGRQINASYGIIGLSADLVAYVGHSGIVPYPRPEGYQGASGGYLTDAEAVELADVMIGRWEEFRAKASAARGGIMPGPGADPEISPTQQSKQHRWGESKRMFAGEFCYRCGDCGVTADLGSDLPDGPCVRVAP